MPSVIQQRAKNSEVFPIFLQVFPFGRLKDHGMVAEAGIVQKQAEARQPDGSFPDMLMAVHVRTQASFAVIEVKKLKPVKTDEVIKAGEGFPVRCFGSDVIAGSEGVAGVKTYPEASSKM